MSLRNLKIRSSLVVALATFYSGLYSGSLMGQAGNDSPFATPKAVERMAPQVEQPTPLDTFEFNGFIKVAGEIRASVFDKTTSKNVWLTLNERHDSGLMLQRFNEGDETIVITRSGVRKELKLKTPEIAPLKVAQSPAVVATSNLTTPISESPNAESDEEVRERMRRVAEEIRRRRAERRALIEQRRREAGN